MLLGKSDSKKSKKKKTNSFDASSAPDLTAPKSLNTIGPPVLGAVTAGLKGGKPLPGISNKMTNSLDSSLGGGLAPLGGGGLLSSSVPSLTVATSLTFSSHTLSSLLTSLCLSN
jgi:hypothetical protein